MRDDLAIVQTVDFFTPIVDDPYDFGAIAAANALSDCYTLGAQPTTGLNLVGFPCSVGLDVLREILRGGSDKINEAGAIIVGGHSVEDPEPKYGIAVTGVVEPSKMITNTNASVGDVLVLNKKIGTGIVTNTFKTRGGMSGVVKSLVKEEMSNAVFEEAVESMKKLNKDAGELLHAHGATACTDITGFGLLGHAQSMAEASGVSIEISYGAVPKFADIERFAIDGTKGGGDRNRKFVEKHVLRAEDISDEQYAVLNDAQTSGPLLISIPEEKAKALLEKINSPAAAIIGRIVEDETPGRVHVVS